MISAFGSRVARSLSSQRESNNSNVVVNLPLNTDRSSSLSRGRELQSTGRGGLGNFRPPSTTREGNPKDGPDDFSPTRGREFHVRHPDEKLYSTGRGGTGNIRSPSRDVLKPDSTEAADENLVRVHLASEETEPHSTGRGGLGNISRSRSREPHGGVVPGGSVSGGSVSGGSVYSSGRGGVGNIHPGRSLAETIDEEERKQLAHDGGIHSTGRGGTANLTAAHEPAVEHHHHNTGEYESTGRGGAGNVVHG